MTYSRKLIVPALAALGFVAFMSVQAGAGNHESAGNDDSQDISQNHEPEGGSGEDDKQHVPPPRPAPSGGSGEDDKQHVPPPRPAPSGGSGEDAKQTPRPAPIRGGGGGQFNGGNGGSFWWEQNRRQIACYNGYGVVMVRDIRDCGMRVQRRVSVGGGVRYRNNNNYGGGLVATKNGGGYNYGGGYGYAQPMVRYYKPASNAAVMQAERRARRAAQYNYGGGYGYDNGGYGGGYAMSYGGGYGMQMGYGAGYNMQMGNGGRSHKVSRKHRRHRGQVYGVMGGVGYGGGYGYNAGYGAGFGYGGTVVHYGPVMTKDGAY